MIKDTKELEKVVANEIKTEDKDIKELFDAGRELLGSGSDGDNPDTSEEDSTEV